LLRKKRPERELDEEIHAHLKREIQQNRDRGMSFAEARRKALVEFGGIESTKERVRDVRGARWLDDFKQDLRYAGRKLAQIPVFSLAVISTLAVGIGASVAMFSVLDAALLRSLPFPEPDRMVLGRATFSGEINEWASFPDYIDYRDGSDRFETMAAMMPVVLQLPVTGSGVPEVAAGNLVSFDFFRALDVDPAMGRDFMPAEAEPNAPGAIIISHGFWQRRFGGAPDTVGTSLTISDPNLSDLPVTVVGIMPRGFRFRYDTDLWLPVRRGMLDTERRRSHSWQVIGRLQEGITLDHAQAQIDVISAQLTEAYPESHENKGLLLTPLGDALAEGYRPALMLLMGATSLLLLIACGNVAGLLLSRATVRKAELSVRAVLGAGRRRLVRQLVTESLLLGSVAGIVGTVLALWIQELVLTLFPLDILGITEVGFSGPMLVFALGITLGTVLIFSAGPAVAASQVNPAEDLRAGRRTTFSKKSGKARSGLVVVQVALSMVLLTGAGLLIRSFVRLQAENLGFRTDNLLTASLYIPPAEYTDGQSRARFCRGVVEDVEAMPGVVSASFIDKVPIRHPFTNWDVWDPANPPQPDENTRSAFARFVLPGYFETMGIPLLHGRDLEERDEAAPEPVVVINRVMADALFPGQDPIGRLLSVNFLMSEDVRPFKIVGIVGNIRMTSVNRAPFLQMYFSSSEWPFNSMQLVVRTDSNPTSLVPAIRQAVLDRNPDAPMTAASTMSEIIADSISGSQTLTLATSFFAVMALLLSMAGLYAVLAYFVSQRSQEIGIRMALGATGKQVLGMVLKRGLELVVLGLLGGLVGAFACARMLQAQLYEVGATDPVTFGAVAAGFLIIGAAASMAPAYLATRVDIVRAMQVD